MTHIVWDWNGTLFDDLELIVAAANDSLALLDVPPIDAGRYRDHYARPIRLFYDRVLGRPITDDEMERTNAAFFDGYRQRVGEGALAADAPAALDLVAARGGTQSILSMSWHHELVPQVESLGVAAYMMLVEGNTGRSGQPKSEMLRSHLDVLRERGAGLDAGSVVVIGDSLDDAAAAGDSGVQSVLYDGGSHHIEELVGTGAPVAGSLVAAVEMAVGT